MTMPNKKFLARNKLRLFIGVGFLGVVTSIINYLTFAKVWSETFVYYGIPLPAVYIGIPILFVLSCWGAGYVYELSGMWAYEVSHQNTTINPEFLSVCEDVQWIRQKLEKQEKS
jgi:hypothetical protein